MSALYVILGICRHTLVLVASARTIGVDLMVVPATPVLFRLLRVHSISWNVQATSIFVSKALQIELCVHGQLNTF